MLNKRILFLTTLMVVAIGTVAIGGAAAQSAPDPGDYQSIIDGTEGDGTEADPHVITNVSELQAINASLSDHYALGNDINASGTENWNGGSGFDPLGGWNSTNEVVTANFIGTFDGQSYSINGLHINRTGEGPVGLFLGFEGSQDTTDISNVGMEVDINGSGYTGGVVGYGGGNISVSDIDVSGSISGGYGTGGVLGTVVAGNISNSSDIKVPNLAGNGAVGGLVGSVWESSIISVNNLDAGNMHSSSFYVGGVAGRVNGDLSDVSNVEVGDVTSTSEQVGGVAGRVNGDLSDVSNVEVGDVTSYNGEVGGVVGDIGGSVTNVESVAVGDVSGSGNNVGGVAGLVNNDISDIESAKIGVVSNEDGYFYIGGVGGQFTNMNNVSNVEVEGVESKSSNYGGVGGWVNGGSITNVTEIVVHSVSGPAVADSGIIAPEGGEISNSIVIAEDVNLKSSSSVNNSVVFGDSINGEITNSYTNNSWYDADGEATGIESFRESTVDDTWEQNIGNLETAPIVPELSRETQFEMFSPKIGQNNLNVEVEADKSGEQITGQIGIDTGVDAQIEFPVTVEMSPEYYDKIDQGTVTVEDSGNYQFLFNTTERDFGNQRIVATVGKSQVTEEFNLSDSRVSGAGDTTFTSIDIPGTDISVPLLPVGAVLVVGALGVGYIYYREEEVDFQ